MIKITNSSFKSFCLAALILFSASACAKKDLIEEVALHDAGLIQWQSWSDKVFSDAKAQGKYVLLDLEAIWCHWCHVMDAKTYSDDKVANYFNEHYIGIKVDQDSRPDLSNLYQDYGWPATIIFNPDGTEIVKRAGYIPAENMIKLLKAVVADPDPVKYGDASPTKFSDQAFLSDDTKAKLTNKFYNSYDDKLGGLKTNHKFMEKDSVEYALVLAADGNSKAESMAKKTLNSALKLFDKAWGGVYQYSTNGDWDHAHFEKIATFQAYYMRIYAQANLILKNKKYLEASNEVYRYLKDFLTSPDGAFYTSQDADLVKGVHSEDFFKLSDKDRRKKGIPSVDKNIYSYQNGLLIDALAHLYEASQDKKHLIAARRAADWIIDNRFLPGGGFKHAADDDTRGVGPYLNDNLYMARALLNLHVVTGDREWLNKARRTADFMISNFKDKVGYSTVSLLNLPKGISKSKALVDENIDFARFMNLLHHYTGNETYKREAEHSMKFLATPSIALKALSEPGILLADSEIAASPVHMTVVGSKKDQKARDLFMAALSYPAATYKRIEWWDKAEGPLPNPDVPYPDLGKAAAFACAFQRCSLPAYTPEELLETVDAMKS